MLKKITAVLLLATVLASALAVASSAAWHTGGEGFKVLNCFTVYPIYAGLNTSPYTNTVNNDYASQISYNVSGSNGYSACNIRFALDYTSAPGTGLFSADFLIDMENYEADSYRCYITFSSPRVYDSGNSYKSCKFRLHKCYWENYRSRSYNYFSSSASDSATASIVIETNSPKIHISLDGYPDSGTFSGDYYKYLQFQLVVNSFSMTKDGSTVAEYEKKEAENSASDVEEQSEQAQSQVTGAIDNTISSLNTLGSAMSTTSTSVNSWTLPAMYIPATSVTPRIELSGEKQIDFASWINAIPPNILTLIQLVCSIALFMYCGKEIIDIISVLLNNRKGIEGLDNDLSKKG